MSDIMNNYGFAKKFESNVKQELLQITTSSAEQSYVELLFEKHIIITPFQDENHIARVDLSSHYSDEIKGISRKISNISLNLRESIISAFELTMDFTEPTSVEAFIKLALVALLKLYRLSKIKLEMQECILLVYLHQHNAYENPVSENRIMNDIDIDALKLSKDEYYKAVRKLVRIASVIMINGEITLMERVVLKYC